MEAFTTRNLLGLGLGSCTGAILKDGDIEHTLPASHKQVMDHVWGAGL